MRQKALSLREVELKQFYDSNEFSHLEKFTDMNRF